MTIKPDFIDRFIDLAQPRLGAEVIDATDDFFAPKERLISPGAPVFIADRFDDHGKWMDGWESRRKRVAGHDHCVVRLCAGTIHGVISTPATSPATTRHRLRSMCAAVTATRTATRHGMS